MNRVVLLAIIWLSFCAPAFAEILHLCDFEAIEAEDGLPVTTTGEVVELYNDGLQLMEMDNFCGANVTLSAEIPRECTVGAIATVTGSLENFSGVMNDIVAAKATCTGGSTVLSCKAKVEKLQSVTDKLNDVTDLLSAQRECVAGEALERERLEILKEYISLVPETFPCDDGVSKNTEPDNLSAWANEQLTLTQEMIDVCIKQ